MEEGWSSRLKYLSMEQFVIARRRPRYVKPISENLDAFSPAGSWSFLVEEAAHAAEGRRKWRSGDACRALTDWRAAGKLEWNWKKIGRWYRFRFRPFHVFRIFSIFLSQKKKKNCLCAVLNIFNHYRVWNDFHFTINFVGNSNVSKRKSYFRPRLKRCIFITRIKKITLTLLDTRLRILLTIAFHCL